MLEAHTTRITERDNHSNQRRDSWSAEIVTEQGWQANMVHDYAWHMEDPNNWRWIWLVAVGVFAVGEALLPGTFFLLPFAAGAVAAAAAAFVGGSLAVQWLLFVAISAVGAVALVPLRRRLDKSETPPGVGSRRLIGQEAVVLRTISAGPGEVGEVRIGREVWRAESATHEEVAANTQVFVTDVRGTAVVVSTQTATR
jgi:membrane protein implicated in regulation of membrane protease activity